MQFPEVLQTQMRGIHMKKSRLLALIFILTIAINHHANAILKTTYSITSNISQEMEEWIDEKTIVFIALDDTLVRPDYKMVGFGANPYRNFESSLISNAKQKKRSAMDKLQKWYNQRKLTLMEEEWRGFIQRSKDKGALVFGVSKMPMAFNDIEKRRYIEIFNLGIEFSEEINGQNILVIGEERKWRSVFYQGILFSGPFNTAKAIEQLLKISNYVPKKIVYFDARENNVRRVNTVLRPFDTDFYSVIYHGIKKYQPEINFEEVQFQQIHFHNTGILLDDSEVAEAMQQAKMKEKQGKSVNNNSNAN